jgi:glycerol-3-phosphate dehydrogenase
VHGVIVGLRPLVADAQHRDTTRISRRHVVESPAPGMTTIAGGTYTTYRVMAADLVDAAAAALGAAARSVTRDVPLLGAEELGRARAGREAMARRAGVAAGAVDRLLRRYGDRAEEVVALAEARPELAAPLGGGGGHLRAEVVHACAYEGALHLDDVLDRRTRLALTAPDRGLGAAADAAALMGGVLGWDGGRVREEVAAWGARIAARRAGEAEGHDEEALAAYGAALAEYGTAAVPP